MYRFKTMRLFTVVFLLFVSVMTGCSDAPAATEETQESSAPATDGSQARVVRVNTTVIAASDFTEIVPLTGVVAAPRDASLSAQSSGTIVELVDIGSRIQEGDVIARLDDRLIVAALEQARANVMSAQAAADFAEDTFRRQEPLYADSIISAIEFENVRTQRNQALAALSQATATVSQAEQQLENTIVRAPFSGTIEQRFAEQGEQVAPGSPMVRLVDTSRLKIQAGVPEHYAADIQRGTNVDISFKSYGGNRLSSTVSFVGSVIDPQNRTFMIEIDVVNEQRKLKPAMIADVFLTRRVLADQIVLPQTSLLRDENGSSVYVVERSTGTPRAVRKNIELGPSYGGETVVSSGLEMGSEVITTGQTMVAEGDEVEIVN